MTLRPLEKNGRRNATPTIYRWWMPGVEAISLPRDRFVKPIDRAGTPSLITTVHRAIRRLNAPLCKGGCK